MTRALIALGLSSCLLASPAWAVDDRIVIVPAKGEFVAQLQETLCISEQCLPETAAMAGERVDFAKVQREGLDAVVSGRVEKDKEGHFVQLTVRNRSGSVKLEHRLACDANGRVSVVDVVAATSKVLKTVEHASFQQVEKERPAAHRSAVATRGKKLKPAKVAVRIRARTRKG